MEFKDLLAKRRSIRKYDARPVPQEVIERLVEATLSAPSSRNSHSTHLMVINDPEVIGRLAEMRDYGSSFMKDAPAAIVVAGDTTTTDLWRENCSISATVLQLAIVDAGLASCWVHVGGRPRLKDEPEGPQAEDFVREVVGVPAEWNIECVIALGYSDFEPKPLPEWDAESTIVWHTRE